jgi:hypothetical protein
MPKTPKPAYTQPPKRRSALAAAVARMQPRIKPSAKTYSRKPRGRDDDRGQACRFF